MTDAPKNETKGVKLGKPAEYVEVKGGLPRLHPPMFKPSIVGKFVVVRKAGDEDTKTYLGVYLGDMLMIPNVKQVDDVIVIDSAPASFMSLNPVMWVPDLNQIVWGCESWWGEIKSEADLKQITDHDIENVWYVKALKAMQDKEAKEAKSDG